MTYYAVTNIDGGEALQVAAGEKVTKSTFTDDEWAGLLAAGAVAEPDRPAELEPDERDARIRELEAQVAKLTQGNTSSNQAGPSSSSTDTTKSSGKS